MPPREGNVRGLSSNSPSYVDFSDIDEKLSLIVRLVGTPDEKVNPNAKQTSSSGEAVFADELQE